MLSDSKTDVGLLLFHLGLKNIGTIGLAYICELMRGLRGIRRKFGKILPNFDEPLRREDLIEKHTDVVNDPKPLKCAGGLRLLRQKFGDASGGPQLPSGDDCLADKSALLSATEVSTSNFVSVVTNGRIWV